MRSRRSAAGCGWNGFWRSLVIAWCSKSSRPDSGNSCSTALPPRPEPPPSRLPRSKARSETPSQGVSSDQGARWHDKVVKTAKVKLRSRVLRSLSRRSHGEEFEKLVARIERTLDSTGAVITHDDHVPEIISGELRQVDVSIKAKIGSSINLITVECRRRSGAEDTTWIEQLIGKMGLIGASRTRGLKEGLFQKGNSQCPNWKDRPADDYRNHCRRYSFLVRSA